MLSISIIITSIIYRGEDSTIRIYTRNYRLINIFLNTTMQLLRNSAHSFINEEHNQIIYTFLPEPSRNVVTRLLT